MRSLAFKLFGEPPGEDASRAATLRWIRGFYLKPLPLVVLVWVFLVVWAPTVVLVLAGAGALIWLQGLVSLSLRIRREERPPPIARS
jgi:hypothetical protein